jgi:hypothetical protein
MRRGRSDAETCALNGWAVGQVLVGDEGYGPNTIQLTAIGERFVLAKLITGSITNVGSEFLWMSTAEWAAADGAEGPE